jgi:hypothetical protein
MRKFNLQNKDLPVCICYPIWRFGEYHEHTFGCLYQCLVKDKCIIYKKRHILKGKNRS